MLFLPPLVLRPNLDPKFIVGAVVWPQLAKAMANSSVSRASPLRQSPWIRGAAMWGSVCARVPSPRECWHGHPSVCVDCSISGSTRCRISSERACAQFGFVEQQSDGSSERARARYGLVEQSGGASETSCQPPFVVPLHLPLVQRLAQPSLPPVVDRHGHYTCYSNLRPPAVQVF